MENYIKSIDSRKGVTVIRLAGTIKLENLKNVQDEFAEKTKGKQIKNILFDLKDVADTDSSGIAALIDLFKYMKANKTGDIIGLVNLSQKMKDLLMISKTQGLFSEYPSEEEAVDRLL